MVAGGNELMPFGTQPGTRVAATLDITSQLTTYVLQAIVGAVAVDVALGLLMCSWFIVGWAAIGLVFGASGFLVTIVIFSFSKTRSDVVRFILGNLWLVGFIVGAIIGYRWHTAITIGVRLIRVELAILTVVSIVALILAWALPKGGKAIVIILWLGIAAGVVMWNPKPWIAAWESLKWLVLPYLWPFAGFAVLLALVLAKEMMFPNLEWTLREISLEELREIGLFGLWLPHFLGGPKEPPPVAERVVQVVAERVVQVEITTENGKKYATLPDTDEARNFYRAVKRGEPFSERTASKYGVTRSVFNGVIREVFLNREWACWKDERHPKQGLDLLPEGWETIEHIVLTGTTPNPPTDD